MFSCGSAAISRLAPKGVILGDVPASEVLSKAFIDRSGSANGFSDFVEGKRLEIAREIEDFQAYDYEGVEIAYSEVKGSKATLLAFWFPT